MSLLRYIQWLLVAYRINFKIFRQALHSYLPFFYLQSLHFRILLNMFSTFPCRIRYHLPHSNSLLFYISKLLQRNGSQMWSLDQHHPHYLGTCYKCKCLGLTTDLRESEFLGSEDLQSDLTVHVVLMCIQVWEYFLAQIHLFLDASLIIIALIKAIEMFPCLSTSFGNHHVQPCLRLATF